MYSNHINVTFTLREHGLGGAALTRQLESAAERAYLECALEHRDFGIPDSSKSTFLTAFSPDGRLLASTHGDHCVYVCDVATGALVHTLKGHVRTPWSLAFHPVNSDLLASGCLGGEIRVWDLKTRCCEVYRVEMGTAIASLAFHPAHRLLAIATDDRLLFWDWSQPAPFGDCRSPSPRERVRFVQFDTFGYKIYTGINNALEDNRDAHRNRYANPPPIIPFRCRELLDSRRDLIDLRADLSRRHSQLLARYQELLGRYRMLQQKYGGENDGVDGGRGSEGSNPTGSNDLTGNVKTEPESSEMGERTLPHDRPSESMDSEIYDPYAESSLGMESAESRQTEISNLENSGTLLPTRSNGEETEDRLVNLADVIAEGTDRIRAIEATATSCVVVRNRLSLPPPRYQCTSLRDGNGATNDVMTSDVSMVTSAAPTGFSRDSDRLIGRRDRNTVLEGVGRAETSSQALDSILTSYSSDSDGSGEFDDANSDETIGGGNTCDIDNSLPGQSGYGRSRLDRMHSSAAAASGAKEDGVAILKRLHRETQCPGHNFPAKIVPPKTGMSNPTGVGDVESNSSHDASREPNDGSAGLVKIDQGASPAGNCSKGLGDTSVRSEIEMKVVINSRVPGDKIAKPARNKDRSRSPLVRGKNGKSSKFRDDSRSSVHVSVAEDGSVDEHSGSSRQHNQRSTRRSARLLAARKVHQSSEDRLEQELKARLSGCGDPSKCKIEEHAESGELEVVRPDTTIVAVKPVADIKNECLPLENSGEHSIASASSNAGALANSETGNIVSNSVAASSVVISAFSSRDPVTSVSGRRPSAGVTRLISPWIADPYDLLPASREEEQWRSMLDEASNVGDSRGDATLPRRPFDLDQDLGDAADEITSTSNLDRLRALTSTTSVSTLPVARLPSHTSGSTPGSGTISRNSIWRPSSPVWRPTSPTFNPSSPYTPMSPVYRPTSPTYTPFNNWEPSVVGHRHLSPSYTPFSSLTDVDQRIGSDSGESRGDSSAAPPRDAMSTATSSSSSTIAQATNSSARHRRSSFSNFRGRREGAVTRSATLEWRNLEHGPLRRWMSPQWLGRSSLPSATSTPSTLTNSTPDLAGRTSTTINPSSNSLSSVSSSGVAIAVSTSGYTPRILTSSMLGRSLQPQPFVPFSRRQQLRGSDLGSLGNLTSISLATSSAATSFSTSPSQLPRTNNFERLVSQTRFTAETTETLQSLQRNMRRFRNHLRIRQTGLSDFSGSLMGGITPSSSSVAEGPSVSASGTAPSRPESSSSSSLFLLRPGLGMFGPTSSSDRTQLIQAHARSLADETSRLMDRVSSVSAQLESVSTLAGRAALEGVAAPFLPGLRPARSAAALSNNLSLSNRAGSGNRNSDGSLSSDSSAGQDLLASTSTTATLHRIHSSLSRIHSTVSRIHSSTISMSRVVSSASGLLEQRRTNSTVAGSATAESVNRDQIREESTSGGLGRRGAIGGPNFAAAASNDHPRRQYSPELHAGSTPPPSNLQESRPPLSPIALEGLQDAVSYARDITKSSMERFMQHHRVSLDRLQRSYMNLSQSAQRLVTLFQSTYDDLCRLQTRITQQQAGQSASTSASGQASSDPARPLFSAMARLQEILLSNTMGRSLDDAAMNGVDSVARIRKETETMAQIYQSMFESMHGGQSSDSGQALQLPESMVGELTGGRDRVEALLARIQTMTINQDDQVNSAQRELCAEIKKFQTFIRNWKQYVMENLKCSDCESGHSCSSMSRASVSAGSLLTSIEDVQPPADDDVDDSRGSSSGAAAGNSSNQRLGALDPASANELNRKRFAALLELSFPDPHPDIPAVPGGKTITRGSGDRATTNGEQVVSVKKDEAISSSLSGNNDLSSNAGRDDRSNATPLPTAQGLGANSVENHGLMTLSEPVRPHFQAEIVIEYVGPGPADGDGGDTGEVTVSSFRENINLDGESTVEFIDEDGSENGSGYSRNADLPDNSGVGRHGQKPSLKRRRDSLSNPSDDGTPAAKVRRFAWAETSGNGLAAESSKNPNPRPLVDSTIANDVGSCEAVEHDKNVSSATVASRFSSSCSTDSNNRLQTAGSSMSMDSANQINSGSGPLPRCPPQIVDNLYAVGDATRMVAGAPSPLLYSSVQVPQRIIHSTDVPSYQPSTAVIGNSYSTATISAPATATSTADYISRNLQTSSFTSLASPVPYPGVSDPTTGSGNGSNYRPPRISFFRPSSSVNMDRLRATVSNSVTSSTISFSPTTGIRFSSGTVPSTLTTTDYYGSSRRIYRRPQYLPTGDQSARTFGWWGGGRGRAPLATFDDEDLVLGGSSGQRGRSGDYPFGHTPTSVPTIADRTSERELPLSSTNSSVDQRRFEDVSSGLESDNRLLAEDEEGDRESSYDLHRQINRAIAGAFISSGDVAVANNILDITSRVQVWPFNIRNLPDLTLKTTNIVVKDCKLHNDASLSFSRSGSLLAAFVENSQEDSVWTDTCVQIVSLADWDLGTVLYSKSFGPNAISVGISPCEQHLLVGLASRRYMRSSQPPKTCAQVFRLRPAAAADANQGNEMELVINVEHPPRDLMHSGGGGIFNLPSQAVSLNTAAWDPNPGSGIILGTNQGRVQKLVAIGQREPEAPLYPLRDIGASRMLLRRRGASFDLYGALGTS